MSTSPALPIELIKESAAYLPPTMSMPLGKAAEAYAAGNFRESLTHALDFFEMSVQWINCYFLAMISGAGAAAKEAARAAAIIDATRPLSFGDCVNELFNPLLEAMGRLYPGHPLVASLGEHVKNRRRDILAGYGKEAGIVKVRNEYKGHSTVLSQAIYRRVLSEISPKVEAYLRGLAPLAQAEVATVSQAGTLISLRGAWADTGTPAGAEYAQDHYYVTLDTDKPVDLYPLALQRDDRFIYIFQTLKDEKVRYESSDENVHGWETAELNADFDRCLRRILPSFDIAKEANWIELCAAMRAHSKSHMVRVQKEKKYNGELFVDRAYLSRLLAKFIESECTLLPMSGDAGQGKTNQMCNWTEKCLEQGSPVVIFNGAVFADATLESSLKALFGANRRRPVKRVLDHLHAMTASEGTNVLFLFDAVNECLKYGDAADDVADAPERLFADIVRLLVSPAYPRFKIVTTCRSFTWKNLIAPRVALPTGLTYFNSDNEAAAVSGFTDSETEAAYSKYGELYQMSTRFADIERKTALRLRDPLIMKFVCCNYVGSALPGGNAGYTSIELFRKMTADIGEKSFAGRRQIELLKELSRIMLMSYLDGQPMGSITNSALKSAYAAPEDPLHRLSRLIYNDGALTVAYTELCNKPDRPILREVERTIGGEKVLAVEFIYERFLEYMMATTFLDHFARPGGSVSASAYVAALERAEANVVFVGAMRNALLIQLAADGDFSVLSELVTRHHAVEGVMQIVGEVIDALIRENYEDLLFDFVDHLLDAAPADSGIIARFNGIRRRIASNKADADTISEHNRISAQLSPVMRLRSTACIAVNNMLLSDMFNEGLYAHDALQRLWRLVADDMEDVSNEACKFIYYLSRRRYTHSRTPLRANLSMLIIRAMYADIKSRTIAANMASASARKRSLTFVETATRLATLMIIDATMSAPRDTATIAAMLREIKDMASYFTWRFRIVRLVMPLLQTIMRKQITFQSVYVNNAIEYQAFWDAGVVPSQAPEAAWSRPRLRDAMGFVGFYGRHHADMSSARCRAELARFRDFLPVVISAYSTGCSFTYFIMERIIAIVGSADWAAVSPVFATLFATPNRDFEWFDYMQMSLLYVLMHIEGHSRESQPEVLEIFTREARDWTLRCRGLFKARNSAKANPAGVYKRNVATWYCMAYCRHAGDNAARPGDERAVPMLYELIGKSVEENDRELLMHLLDNIAELISDSPYVRTALSALRYVMEQFDSQDKVDAFDSAPVPSGRYAGVSLTAAIGSVLGMAKTYFPAETDSFLRSDISGLKFPGVTQYREEILNYHPGGEALSDLFTHKFGGFLLWSLMHEKVVDDFAFEAVCAAIDSKDCFQWFDQVIRLLFEKMFGVKI